MLFRSQFAKIAGVCGLEGSKIPMASFVPYHQRKPSFLDEDQGGECSRNAAVPVLERVNLREPMMQPRGLHLRRGHVTVVQLNESVHFRGYVLRWTVLMKGAVGSVWIIVPLFVVATNQLDAADSALCVGGLHPLLAARHEGMHLLYVARGQGALTLHESEDALYRGLLISDHGGNRLRMLAISVRDERRVYSPLDEQLSDSAIEHVQPFDQTSLDRPLSVQSLVEPYERILPLQLLALLLPDCRQMFQLRLRELPRIGLVIADEIPRVTPRPNDCPS